MRLFNRISQRLSPPPNNLPTVHTLSCDENTPDAANPLHTTHITAGAAAWRSSNTRTTQQRPPWFSVTVADAL